MAWRSSRVVAAAIALVCALSLAAPASAEVFMSRADALAWAFPGADRIDDESYVLDAAQTAAIEQRAQSKLESKLVTIYTGRKGDTVLGYAVIDQHVVRTFREAFLVVLNPDGRVARLRVLAFHEPPEYKPNDRFLAQFEGREAGAPLRLRREIHGIAGATLSSQAVTGGVRRVLALHDVLIREQVAQHRP